MRKVPQFVENHKEGLIFSRFGTNLYWLFYPILALERAGNGRYAYEK